MDSNNQMIEGDDLQLKDLILNHSLKDSDSIMENISCDDLLDLSLREHFAEINHIFEEVSNLPLAYPSL